MRIPLLPSTVLRNEVIGDSEQKYESSDIPEIILKSCAVKGSSDHTAANAGLCSLRTGRVWVSRSSLDLLLRIRGKCSFHKSLTSKELVQKLVE